MISAVMFFNIVGLFLFTFFALPTIYQLQIKEYYYPRIREGIREKKGFLIPLKLPAFSPRNILIMLFVILVMMIYFYLMSYYFTEITLWYALFWFLGTFLAKFSAMVGMLITEPIAAIRRNMLMRKASNLRDNSSAQFIGITGSYGKSSTKEFIATLLSEKYNVASTSQNKNSEVGVAICIIENLEEGTDYFVAEMGAYSLGTIERTSSIVKPKYGFITGIGIQHISLFGSQENIIDGKSELVESLPDDGVLYLNADFKYSSEVTSRADCKVVTYSMEDRSSTAFLERVDDEKIAIEYKGKKHQFITKIDVDHQLLNLMGAIIFTLDHGLTDLEIQKVLNNLEIPQQKLSKKKLQNGAILIDDSYNSNREGFLEALDYIGNSERKKIILTRGIIELGDNKDEVYEELALKSKEIGADIYTTDRDFLNHQSEGIKIALANPEKMLKLIQSSNEEQIILLEGRFPPNFMKSLKDSYEV